jgi:hypothetical protein
MRAIDSLPKSLIALIGAVLLGGAGYLYWINSSSLFQCNDVVKKEASSPDAAYVATFFERNCGATTDYISIVSIRPRADRFDAEKNDAVLVIRGRCPVELLWGERVLRVSYTKPCALAKQVDTWRDVSLSFDSS